MSKTKRNKRITRHLRVRARVKGTADKPRIAVFKSNRHIYVQAIDDTSGKTLVSIQSLAVKKKVKGNKTQIASDLGNELATRMKEKGLTSGVFDKAGFKYHGRVKAIAEGLRANGIKI